MKLTPTVKKTIRDALANSRADAGDNLGRAKWQFDKCTPEQMQQYYGESGQTRQEILDNWQKYYDEVEEAARFIDELFADGDK